MAGLQVSEQSPVIGFGFWEPALSQEHRPSLSKYRICGVGVAAASAAGIVMPYRADGTGLGVGLGTGAFRRSLTALERMFVARVWEVALRFVCTPMGIRPKTASKQ